MAYRNIHGAISVERNDKDAILEATQTLLSEMINQNTLDIEQINAVIMTATHDLTMADPAAAAREMGMTQAGLVCAQEMAVVGGPARCIRVMMNVETERRQADMQHVYMRDAQWLRPDLLYDKRKDKKFHTIAIDGPCGAGKSTIAKMVAARLGFIYVDTGAMYRAIALYCLIHMIDLEDESAIAHAVSGLSLSIRHVDGVQCIFMQGDNVTHAIRTTAVADGASKVAVFPEVREKLVRIQRELAESDNVVMDGRDIGTSVLPHATLKIYLDATVIERAKRRFADYKERGFEPDFETVCKELEERDFRDMHREASPLRKADDALVLDSSAMDRETVAQAIEDAFYARIGEKFE